MFSYLMRAAMNISYDSSIDLLKLLTHEQRFGNSDMLAPAACGVILHIRRMKRFRMWEVLVLLGH